MSTAKKTCDQETIRYGQQIWDTFFEEFDKPKLDFLYQDGKDSTFYKFVNSA